jgi:AGZA family xanthine/uracil permease-like MFS transporter
MGLNAVVAFQLVQGMRLPWQAAMGVILLEGVAITVLVLTGFREAMMNAIPASLKRAIGVGIGLFILFIGMYQGGFVRVPVPLGQPLTAPPSVPLELGNFATLPFLVALIGLLLGVALLARGVPGALLISILGTTLIAMVIRYATGAQVSTVPGKAEWPAQPLSFPDFSTFGGGLNIDVFFRVGVITAIVTIFSIMLSDFFDTMGTVIGIGSEAGWLDEQGRLPRLNRVLLIDSLGAVFGGIASSSSATTYIESAAGVAEGAKTGVASILVGLLFLACLFIAPIAGIVPPEATAAALILVGFFMARVAREIDFSNIHEGLPALMTLITMPLTWSITNGIGAGFVTYSFIKLVTGRAREVHLMLWLASAAFVLYFALPWVKQVFRF